MRKKAEHKLKAERREIKKRPHMRVRGAALKQPSKRAGLAIIKKSQTLNTK